jgi:hypothetical protein
MSRYEAFEHRVADSEYENGVTLRTAIRTTNLNHGAGVSATVANRTHRVVRQRAEVMRARKSMIRSLWAPLLVCAGLLVALSCAVWNALDDYEAIPTGIPDASQQLLVLMMWSLPLSAALLAFVWFRRSRERIEDEGDRR